MGWIYLSHVLDETTPLYGGTGRVRITRVRSMAKGGTSNSSELALPAHSCTHVDAPRHFDPSGSTLDVYAPDHWNAARPWLLDVPCRPAELLDWNRTGHALQNVPADCDLLLLRTGAEIWRVTDPLTYARKGPGISRDVAVWLRRNLRLRFLGVDFISVSSFAHRAIGREAHRALLGPDESGAPPILPIEDMALSLLRHTPRRVWILPLRYDCADGAPVTVVAQVRPTASERETERPGRDQ